MDSQLWQCFIFLFGHCLMVTSFHLNIERVALFLLSASVFYFLLFFLSYSLLCFPLFCFPFPFCYSFLHLFSLIFPCFPLFLSSFFLVSLPFCSLFLFLFFFLRSPFFLSFYLSLSPQKLSSLFPCSFFFSSLPPFFFLCFPIFISRRRGATLSCPIIVQRRVAWGILCRAGLPSPFFSVITGRVEEVRLVSVLSSWGKRKKVSTVKKTNSKREKTFFFPCCMSNGRRRTMSFKMTSFRASPPLFLNEQCMKQHCFDQNTSFQLKHGAKIC